jgi:hypothetical protein
MGAERDLESCERPPAGRIRRVSTGSPGARQSAENLRKRRRRIVQDQCDPSSKHIVRLALESAQKVRAVSGHTHEHTADHSVNWVYV